MATLVQHSEIAARIEQALEYLTEEWQAIPEVVATWETWDELDRLDFVLEWPLREIQMDQLRQWRNEGQLSPQQALRFAQLELLIHGHRAAVDRILAE